MLSDKTVTFSSSTELLAYLVHLKPLERSEMFPLSLIKYSHTVFTFPLKIGEGNWNVE